MNAYRIFARSRFCAFVLLLAGAACRVQGALPATDSLPAPLRLLGIHDAGRVLLRWAPQDFPAWQQGIRQGYTLERYTLLQNGATLSPAQITASRTTLAARLLPQPESVFEQMADSSNAAGVAGAALYEPNVEMSISTGNDAFIRALSRAEQNDTRFSLGLVAADASFPVAAAMALGYTDLTAAPNSVYEYRLLAHSADAATARRVRIDTRTALTLPPLPAPAPETGPGAVLLSWQVRGLDMYYRAYDLERSADGGASWQKRNSEPVLPQETETAPDPTALFYTDSLESAEITYQYRLRGHSIFGVSAAGPATEVSSLPPLLSENPALRDVLPAAGGALRLQWAFPEALSDQIQGFQAYRAPFTDGPFEAISPILPPSARDFTDPQPRHTNYYLIKAIDLHGREAASLSVLGQPEDLTPPAKVSGLSGAIHPNGAVTLQWTPNADDDLYGYRIYQADGPDAEYVQISAENVSANNFALRIPMNTLAKKAYFRVRAADFRDNLGEPSDPLELALPDVMPPAPPHLASVEPMKGGGVQVVWSPSPSPDVQHYQVQRRSLLQSSWTAAASVPAAGTLAALQTTLDTTLSGAAEWEYRIVATDSAGLTGISPALKVTLPSPKRPAVVRLRAETAIADHKTVVKLSWEYPYDPLLHEFAIYRSENGGPMRLLRLLELPEFAPVAIVEEGRGYFVWRDTQAAPGIAYRYQLTARFLDGSEAPMSAAVSKSF